MRTKIARMIEEAVEDCIAFGRGSSNDMSQNIQVQADWTEEGDEIEIVVYENFAIRFSYTERVDV